MQIEGVRETVTTLRKLEPSLARAAVRDIKAAAEPARAGVVSDTPARPLSGMDQPPVKASTRYGGRGRPGPRGTEYPLVRIRLDGPRWTAAADMAMTGHTPAGRAWVRSLTARYGGRSRFVWPAVDRYRGSATSAIAAAAAKVETVLTRELRG
jgi:hypothetical protein